MTDVVEIHTAEPVLEIIAGPVGVLELSALAVSVLEVITPGPMGPPGVRGEQGQDGASLEFTQTFAIATDTWTIVHDLNGHPEVTTVDLNGAEIIGDVEYPDNMTVIVWFAMPVAGVARLKA